MPARVKDIYVAGSLDELKVKSDVKFDGKDPAKLKKSAVKVFQEAEERRRDGDEESSYIFFMKFCHIFNYLNDHHGMGEIKPLIQQYKEAIERAEVLTKNLKSRYEAILKSRKPVMSPPKESAPVSKPAEPSRSRSTGEKGDALNGSSGDEFVSCKYLYDLLHAGNRIGGASGQKSILLIDLRSSKYYNASHIKSEFSINIPEEMITRDKTASYYKKAIESQFIPLWERRKEVDILLLIDWSTTNPDIIPDSVLDIFKGIIEKWDPGQKYKSCPHFLDGGYERFVSEYPMLTTNPRISAPSIEAFDSLSIQDISYPNLSESPTESSFFSSGHIPASIGNSEGSNYYRPGINQIPVYPSAKPPSVDRSSKANAELLYERCKQDQLQLERDIDKNKHKLDSVEHELIRSQTKELLEEREKLQQECSELRKQHSSKEEENERLRREIQDYKQRDRLAAARQAPKPRINQMTITDEPMRVPGPDTASDRVKPLDESKGLVSNDDVQSIPTKGSEPPGVNIPDDLMSDMKRSHSTPNIVQEPQQEWQQPPSYDRSTKPIQTSHGSMHGVYGSYRGSGLTGLKNLGNTCYMNSIIQCISNTSRLSEYFCYGKYKGDLNTSRSNPTGGDVADKLAFVVRQLWCGEYKFTGCEDLKRVVGRYSEAFAGTSQQDSHEFLTFLMDWLHNDLCRSPGKKPVNHELICGPKMAWIEYKKAKCSVISELFFVQQVSTVVCRKCRVKSVTYEEPTSNLTLQLPSANNRISLQDCLQLYTEGELISGYKCESCEQINDATKKVDIWRLPQILVIHLKRFYSDGLYHKRQTLVDFPLKNLEMSEFTSNTEVTNTRYDLYAVSNHYGTLEGGHYTAYCKNKEKWYKFDDQDVTEIPPTYVKSANAYILFYEQVC